MFGIDPVLHNVLLLAYIRYTDMIGTTTQEFHQVAGEDRVAFPECFPGDYICTVETAVCFMEACEMPQEQSMMWVARGHGAERQERPVPSDAGTRMGLQHGRPGGRVCGSGKLGFRKRQRLLGFQEIPRVLKICILGYNRGCSQVATTFRRA